jgi:hypothetical protein
MSTATEPPNGDFVAYIEELQRESAARLQAQLNSALVEHPKGPAPQKRAAAPTTQQVPLTRPQIDALLSRLASQRATARLLGPVVGLFVGAALFLTGAIAGGVPSMLIGFGLIVWSARRLTSVLRTGAPASRTQDVVSEFFGKPPGA